PLSVWMPVLLKSNVVFRKWQQIVFQLEMGYQQTNCAELAGIKSDASNLRKGVPRPKQHPEACAVNVCYSLQVDHKRPLTRQHTVEDILKKPFRGQVKIATNQ
ncbi:MAG TPA: hypothetical protein VFW40_10885, partial [Capsulimonadaceae bacterium]|nr:hypothetical protein [Capsulimonadaceae bacterium]